MTRFRTRRCIHGVRGGDTREYLCQVNPTARNSAQRSVKLPRPVVVWSSVAIHETNENVFEQTLIEMCWPGEAVQPSSDPLARSPWEHHRDLTGHAR